MQTIPVKFFKNRKYFIDNLNARVYANRKKWHIVNLGLQFVRHFVDDKTKSRDQ